ncbi:MAG: hypothetical protein QOH90_1677 [Actinomycetota bacterium]|nr:hypothetical protein [Actinomycetota bacterium]
MAGVEIGARPKIVLGLIIVVGLLIYLVIVDLGINAGRIHRGVEITGLDLGGLTPTEAEDALRARADELKYSLITFARDDVVCRFTPLEVGWSPRMPETAEVAREVGRGDNIFSDLSERLRAWIFGQKVHWKASVDAGKLHRTVTQCKRAALAEDVTLDTKKLRRKIRRAIVHWPRRIYAVPVEAPDGHTRID